MFAPLSFRKHFGRVPEHVVRNKLGHTKTKQKPPPKRKTKFKGNKKEMSNAELIEFVNNNRVFYLTTCIIIIITFVRNMFLIEATNTEIIFNVKTYKPIYKPKQLTQNSNVGSLPVTL